MSEIRLELESSDGSAARSTGELDREMPVAADYKILATNESWSSTVQLTDILYDNLKSDIYRTVAIFHDRYEDNPPVPPGSILVKGPMRSNPFFIKRVRRNSNTGAAP